MSDVPLVREYMKDCSVLLKPELDIYQAIRTLLKHKLSGAPVVDKDHNLVGMLSEKDCLKLFANGAFNMLPGGDVGHYMTRDLMTIGPDEGIFTAAEIFLKNSFRRLPVIENDRLIGQISRRDILEGSRKVWETCAGEKPWTDAKYLTEEIKAALR